MRIRLRLLATLAIVAGGASAAATLAAQEAPKSIKVGYAVSLSGPDAGGAASTVSTYRLWAADVNKSGGILLKKYGQRVPVETVEIDDGSNIDDLARHVERLMSADKVDIVLPPAGIAQNLRAGPIFNRHGYPQLMGTASSEDAERLVSRFPNMFFFLGKPSEQVNATVEFLAEQVKKGSLRNSVAMFAVQNASGSEYLGAAKAALSRAGLQVVYERSYAPGAADLSAEIQAAKAAEPDILLVWSSPADALAITEQSIANDFNPRFKLVAAGGASPAYKGKFGDKINGWFSLGGIDLSTPGVRSWFDRHKAANKGVEPDRWTSLYTYAGLEALQQAIERVGEIERARILAELQTGKFKTLLGEIQLKGNRTPPLWQVGQWQRGEFYGVAPADRPGARAPVFAKQGR